MSVKNFFDHRWVAAVDMTAVVLFLALNLLVPVAHCKSSFNNNMDPIILPNCEDIDFIVIGNGFAGHVVANRLSENPDWKVLFLELSHDNEVEELSQISYTPVKGNTGLAFKNNIYYWPYAYATQPQCYTHGFPEHYSIVENEDNLDWCWDDIVPNFEKTVSQNKSSYVMMKKPEMSPAENDVKKMVLGAAEYLTSVRGGTSNRVTKNPLIAHTETLLMVPRKAEKRPNLRNIKGAIVSGINFDSTGKRVSNVTFFFENRSVEFIVPVKKELVLSAGTIDSAKLLMLSGVGREDHLKSLNIPVRHKLPVGDNMQDHLIVPLFLEMTSSKDSPHHKQPLLDSMIETSIGYNASESIGELDIGIFFDITNDPVSFITHFEYSYFYIRCQEFKQLRNWAEFFRLDEKYLRNLMEIIKNKDLLIVGIVVAHPKSVGTVRLRSANYRDMPIITPNYFDDASDVRKVKDGIGYVMKMEKSPDFQKKNVKLAHVPIEECDRYIFKSDDYWLCYRKYFSISQLDHVGTLKIGSPPNPGCVNSRLRMHGVGNLRVADASVLPTITGSNVRATSILIGEKVVQYIKEDYGLLGKGFARI